jgi:hypothetical protein
MNRNLELRMYGLVPYNISPIQQAIQFGHAVVEYGQMVKLPQAMNKMAIDAPLIYDSWASKWKTFIILNGGTTNHKLSDEGLPFGTLNQHVLKLDEMNIDFATFNEPDLGDQLTAVVFIVDERVFNRKKYPDFSDWLMDSKYADLIRTELGSNVYTISENIKNSTNKQDQKSYKEWVDIIGGEKNVFLRDFLKNFKLA